jgi:hypothetical protein
VKKLPNYDLSQSSLTKMCEDLGAFINFESKMNLLCSRLAKIAEDEAKERFAAAAPGYIGNRSVSVTANQTANGWEIRADGEEVAFMEFGAGVGRTGWDGGALPPGIVEHGQYGQGKGANPPWVFEYPKGSGKFRSTYGNDAANAMSGAMHVIRSRFPEIAREVFGHA